MKHNRPYWGNRPSTPGNSIGEYVLIGLIGFGLTASGFLLLGGNLQNVLSAFKQDMSQQIASTNAATGKAKPKPASVVASLPPPSRPDPSAPLPNKVTIRFTTANGKPITLNNYSNIPLSKNVATAGANGATQILANQLDALIQSLSAAGELTPTQYNTLIALANQGHRLGNLIGVMEQLANQNKITRGSIYYEGRSYTAESLSSLISYNPPSNVRYKYDLMTGYAYSAMPSDPMNPLNGAGKELQTFINLYNKAEKSGALNDPTVAEIITSLSNEIVYISEAVDQSAGTIFAKELREAMLLEQAANKLVHVDSTGICVTGKGQDTGIQCSG